VRCVGDERGLEGNGAGHVWSRGKDGVGFSLPAMTETETSCPGNEGSDRVPTARETSARTCFDVRRLDTDERGAHELVGGRVPAALGEDESVEVFTNGLLQPRLVLLVELPQTVSGAEYLFQGSARPGTCGKGAFVRVRESDQTRNAEEQDSSFTLPDYTRPHRSCGRHSAALERRGNQGRARRVFWTVEACPSVDQTQIDQLIHDAELIVRESPASTVRT
jgi:hypothetical protein